MRLVRDTDCLSGVAMPAWRCRTRHYVPVGSGLVSLSGWTRAADSGTCRETPDTSLEVRVMILSLSHR